MFAFAIKNLLNNKIRLSLTAVAIILGVGFVASSFILRDGLKDSFASLSEDIVGQTDIRVTPGDDDQRPLTTADLDAVKEIEGVKVAEGGITSDLPNPIQAIKNDGTTITDNGPPQVAFVWSDQQELYTNNLSEGRAPTGPGEWVVDVDAAENHGFTIGETYDFVTPAGRKSGELVGTFTFGENNTTNGATLYAFSSDTIREYLQLDDAYLNSIEIATEDGADVDDVIERISVDLGNPANTDFRVADPDDLEVVILDQADLVADVQGEFNAALDIFGGILLGFALVALFVSIFIVANTFSIVVAQRIRELGLLRAVGATPGQIRKSVLFESLAIGLVASLVGILAGLGIALGLIELLNAVGFSLPPFELVVTTTTILISLFVGTVVTVISALGPAFAASKTSPIAAISGTSDTEGRSALRYILGGIASLGGIALLAIGLFGGSDSVTAILSTLGLGAAILFVGLTMLSPLVAAPVSRLLGLPFGPIFGVTGELSTENAARNPRRTATTSAALMIGLSLISMALVVGASFKAQFNEILSNSVQADYIVSSQTGFVPQEVVAAVQEDSTFSQVNAIRFDEVDLADQPAEDGPTPARSVASLDFDSAEGLLDFDVSEGSLDAMTESTAGVSEDLAKELDLTLGDTVSPVLTDGSVVDLTVNAIFKDTSVAGDLLVTETLFERISDADPGIVFAKRSESVSVADADATFQALEDQYPNLAFESAAEFRESISSQIDQILNIMTMLLGLAIIIALLGIANTLALSVFERTREIGLLRAVGMARRQIRRMVRLEASLISGLGAILGAAIGVVLGIAAVIAIPDSIIGEIAVPWTRILILVLIGSFSGLLSAILPAFRASRMKILDAIND